MSYDLSKLNVVQAWLAKEYGFMTSIQVNQFTLGTTPFQEIVPNNGNRVGLAIINNGSGDALVAPENPQMNGLAGIALSASGGSVTMTLRDDYMLLPWRWIGQQETINGSITTIEVVAISNFGGTQ